MKIRIKDIVYSHMKIRGCNFMTNKKRVPWNKGIKTNKPALNSLNLNRDTLFNLYIEQGMSSTDIAKHFNCSNRTILNWLHRYEIPVRSDSDSVRLNRSKWSKEKELQRSITYHNTWANKSQEEKDLINQKRENNPNINSEEAIRKANQTRILNGTSVESKAENAFYHSLLLFGFDEDDILRHYMDNRYPYNCDFYIKSKDLFIEYQGHFTHGPEPFDSTNRFHLDELKRLQSLGRDMRTWTDRDVKKLYVAKRNRIKLLLVYPRHKAFLVKDGNITTIDINNINKI